MNITLTTSVVMMYLFISLEKHVKINGKKIAVKFINEAYNLKFINVKNILLPIYFKYYGGVVAPLNLSSDTNGTFFSRPRTYTFRSKICNKSPLHLAVCYCSKAIK